MKLKSLFSLAIVLSFAAFVVAQQPYEKKTATLMTTWGEQLQATDPILAEYPRPQMMREKWLNLNGLWQFQPAASFDEALPAGNLARQILVPFPVQSALSGIKEQHENVWYRRTFTVPTDWSGQRIWLHFGAVDYKCAVFINGQSVGTHEGGYDPFSFDITDKLTTSGSQTVLLKVNDQTDAIGYPRGKQSLYPGGIMYTCTTGIWQTVWLEPVNQNSLQSFRMVPNIDKSTVVFYPITSGTLRTYNFRFKIYDNGVQVADIEKIGNSTITLDIPAPLKLWSPTSPFLYDMKVILTKAETGEAVDSISTYFGMRKISKKLIDGYQRMCLNNEPLFHMGPLDQGFWPDGIYTAPTDEALRFDIEKMKELGFNMVRKHIKVEPQRWYYWCDKLGLLVWQDMPSMNSYICVDCPDKDGNPRGVPRREDTAFKRELERMIKTHWNSPAIVSWVIFNEYQGSHDEANLCDQVKVWDNSRIVNINSGVNDLRYDGINTDIRDYHNYSPPSYPPKNNANTQILVCGEYGGVGYEEAGHIWQSGNPYETVNSYATLLSRYTDYGNMLINFKSNKGLMGAVYTEITDVEMELNGLLTYDRKITKGDAANFFDVNQRIINEFRYYNDFIPTSEYAPQTWKYTTQQPAGNWFTSSFNDDSWQSGQGGFGTKKTPGTVVNGDSIARTIWNTNNIWLRRKVFFPATAPEGILQIRIHHDEDAQVYINDVPALNITGYTGDYIYVNLTAAGKNAIRWGEENVIAVHCKQTSGGQYIDVGFATVIEETTSVVNSEIKKNSEITIYPNPVKNELRITNYELRIESAEIFDVTGRKIFNFQFSIFNSIDVSALQKGMYLLRLKTENGYDTQTFIKE